MAAPLLPPALFRIHGGARFARKASELFHEARESTTETAAGVFRGNRIPGPPQPSAPGSATCTHNGKGSQVTFQHHRLLANSTHTHHSPILSSKGLRSFPASFTEPRFGSLHPTFLAGTLLLSPQFPPCRESRGSTLFRMRRLPHGHAVPHVEGIWRHQSRLHPATVTQLSKEV